MGSSRNSKLKIIGRRIKIPKTFSARNIANIFNVAFNVDEAGKITTIEVTCEVNFGEMGLSQMVDVWSSLTTAQKMAAQSFYNRLKAILKKQFID